MSIRLDEPGISPTSREPMTAATSWPNFSPRKAASWKSDVAQADCCARRGGEGSRSKAWTSRCDGSCWPGSDWNRALTMGRGLLEVPPVVPDQMERGVLGVPLVVPDQCSL